MNTLVIGNWKLVLVEWLAPQNNLWRDKAEFIAYCSKEEHHCDQGPQCKTGIMISQSQTGGHNETEVMIDGSFGITSVWRNSFH